MSTIMRGILNYWGPIIILIICTQLFQGLSGRPRLRHSHRKLRCSKCPPGWGVAQICTTIADTSCTRCAHNYYSPHHSYHNPCWLCSRCGTGLYEAHPCQPSADTICDDCLRTTIETRDLSEDFYGKCVGVDNVTVVQRTNVLNKKKLSKKKAYFLK